MVRHPLTMLSVSMKTKVFINPNYQYSTNLSINLKRNLKIPKIPIILIKLSYSSTSAFTMHSMSRILQQIKIRIPHRGPFLKKLKKLIVKRRNFVGTSLICMANLIMIGLKLTCKHPTLKLQA